MAHPHPAVGLVDEDAGKAHFAELPPQRMAEAVLAIHVAIFAELLADRAFGRPEIRARCRAACFDLQ
jgi:hypothetical protein